MGLVIKCECGATVHGDGEAALLAAAEAHIESDHAPAAGAATSADLLAMAFAEKEEA